MLNPNLGRLTVIIAPFAALFTLLACGAPASDDTAVATGGVDEPGGGSGFSTGDATAGEAVYGATCVNCHGATGDLGVPINGTAASDLGARVPDMSDDEIAHQVQSGGSAMPAQGLDDTDTADVIAYVRATFG